MIRFSRKYVDMAMQKLAVSPALRKFYSLLWLSRVKVDVQFAKEFCQKHWVER